jgi:hypothetical protein
LNIIFERIGHLMNLTECLPRRLQDITEEVGNHIKYYSEELFTRCAFFQGQNQINEEKV